MSRPLQRAQLESGLKLDLNSLARRGFVHPGGYRGCGIAWTNGYTGEAITSGWIMADMTNEKTGSFRIKIGHLDQCITLVAAPRHFGGRQWYFICPCTSRIASVLWMPPGARSFACRERWGRQVAYASQFLDRDNRAHRGQAKIRARLCAVGGFDPEEWDFPPKPKWMRWRTYKRVEAKFDYYEAVLDEGLSELAARLVMRLRG